MVKFYLSYPLKILDNLEAKMAAVPLSTPFEKRLLQNGDKFLQELSKQTESKCRTCCLLANSSKCAGEFMIIAHKLLESLKLKFNTEEEVYTVS